jgi:hypothetical protein
MDKVTERIFELLDELGAVDALRAQVRMEQRYLVDRLEAAMLLSRPPTPAT